jgi:hypothetical protein
VIRNEEFEGKRRRSPFSHQKRERRIYKKIYLSVTIDLK